MTTFNIQPLSRFVGESEPVKRPKEFACFSYDEDHTFQIGDASLRYYYPPELGADLSDGYRDLIKHDDSKAEHLDSLLRTIMHHEQETGVKIDAQVVTWRGVMTKIMTSPFEDRDGFELNCTRYQDCLFIEENHEHKLASKQEQAAQPWRGPIPQDVMSFWGYKFETLSTLPRSWAETTREYIENRHLEVVSNKAQYCSVVRTGVGKTILCLGGEVDAVWDAKPMRSGDSTKWVELKTSAEIRNDRDMDNFERKLLKFWVQSFLLGVPKIVVGFRSREGILQRLEEIDTASIPNTVQTRRRDPDGRTGKVAGPPWDGNVCINFAAAFLDALRNVINDSSGGVWRIRRRPREQHIEIVKQQDTGYGEVLTNEFVQWRTQLLQIAGPASVQGIASRIETAS